MDETYNKIVAFHGHSCPGLAIGYRMSKAGIDFLSNSRAEDEEIVAIVENDACGVDALQCITGCTFGKGNLIFKDYGKHVYTIYDRKSGKGVRVVLKKDNIPENVLKDRDDLVDWILNTAEDNILSLSEACMEEPEHAKIITSVKCDFCGEHVMESKTVNINKKVACIPCGEQYGIDNNKKH